MTSLRNTSRAERLLRKGWSDRFIGLILATFESNYVKRHAISNCRWPDMQDPTDQGKRRASFTRSQLTHRCSVMRPSQCARDASTRSGFAMRWGPDMLALYFASKIATQSSWEKRLRAPRLTPRVKLTGNLDAVGRWPFVDL